VNKFQSPVHTSTKQPQTAIIMPSRGNPNVPNKQRRIASRSKIQKRNAVNKVSKNPRGTARSNVLLPTSGPLAPPSSKKARKLEKAKNHARQRAVEKAMQQQGEVQMTGILPFEWKRAHLINGLQMRQRPHKQKLRRRKRTRWKLMAYLEPKDGR
jgi:hypothetical protein